MCLLKMNMVYVVKTKDDSSHTISVVDLCLLSTGCTHLFGFSFPK